MSSLNINAIKPCCNVRYSDGYGSESGYGEGYGYGDGYGSGYGYGDGSGYGDGDGDGSGDGGGSGYGSGDGSGVRSFNGETVHKIDGVQTLVRKVRGNIAKGAILNANLILTPCFIVKQDSCFAHGRTLREAMAALREKLFEDMSEEDRIKAFMREHPEPEDRKYKAKDLYDWHHMLTGSCKMGRMQFARDHGIDLEKDELTVEEFIKLTENAYGGDVILRLKAKYKEDKS